MKAVGQNLRIVHHFTDWVGLSSIWNICIWLCRSEDDSIVDKIFVLNTYKLRSLLFLNMRKAYLRS